MPKVYLESYGCSANKADAEIARGILTEDGYEIVKHQKDSDINIILTCVVKTPTERKVTKKIRELNGSGKPLIVAGCMPKSMTNQARSLVPKASLLGPDNIEQISNAVKSTLSGKRVILIDGKPTDRTCFPRIRENKLIHIAPISSGCLGNCSYCIVKFARGNLYSFPAEKIVGSVKTAIDQGCCEVWVTAEDTAAYNDNGTRLPELLNMITDVEGEFRVRVGMMTPNQLKPILNEMIETLHNPKIYKFIHLPTQSGNDLILQKMRRRYSVQEFKSLVKILREYFPNIGISTDMICGFPGETFDQFQDSLNLLEWLQPDVLNINRFWERPGTDASKMSGRLHGRDIKERSRMMTKLWKNMAIEVGEKWINWEGDVLLNEYGKYGTKVGRNYAYKAVALKTDLPLGNYVKVRVNRSGVGYLKAIEA